MLETRLALTWLLPCEGVCLAGCPPTPSLASHLSPEARWFSCAILCSFRCDIIWVGPKLVTGPGAMSVSHSRRRRGAQGHVWTKARVLELPG